MKVATVLAVREWTPATLLEIDLHLPQCDMHDWKGAQHMKCKVGPLTYRDYSLTGWDADTRTCTLIIDAAHQGPGSHWARSLKKGDAVDYLGIGSSHQGPVRGKHLVFLGDETAIGHFFALQQLAGDSAIICGAIAMAEKSHRSAFKEYYPGVGLEPLNKRNGSDFTALEDWIGSFNNDAPDTIPDTMFYLAGQVSVVVGLRKALKKKGYSGSQVNAQGFWK